MKTISRWTMSAFAALLLAQSGCTPAADDDASCEGGKCDDGTEVAAAACDGKIEDMSGRGLSGRIAGRLDDAVANKVLKPGDSCPVTFKDIMAKMRTTDSTGCTGDAKAGLATMVVSERSQIIGRPESYRLVVTRTCDGRQQNELFMSLFGVGPDGTPPDDVEMIALDKTKGVFNFYAAEGGRWKYFGDSTDLLEGPGDGGDERRCANCHTAGGVIMKELDTPWSNWEGHVDTPGSTQVIAASPDYGSKSNGIALESLIRAGNDRWNQAKVAHLKKNGTVRQMLEPLFCTVQVNVDNGSDFNSPATGGPGGDDLSKIPADFLLDPALKSFGSVSIDFADYQQQLGAIGQKVNGSGGRQLSDSAGGAIVDTIFDFVFVERSAEDQDYVRKLRDAGILDDDFIKDVLMVDFTRPIESTDRCGLLDFAPDIDEGGRTAQAIRDGFVAALQGVSPIPGSAEAQLLANLQNTGDAQAHQTRVDAFLAACGARPKAAFVADVMKLVSLNRSQGRQRTVFEFPETLPVDSLSVDPATRFDPTTCELTTSLPAPPQ